VVLCSLFMARLHYLLVFCVLFALCIFAVCRPGSGGHEEKPSNVLFFTVYNPKYPITVVCNL